MPFVLAALRMLFPVAASLRAVLVSMAPFAATRPTALFTVAEGVPATLAAPGTATDERAGTCAHTINDEISGSKRGHRDFPCLSCCDYARQKKTAPHPERAA